MSENKSAFNKFQFENDFSGAAMPTTAASKEPSIEEQKAVAFQEGVNEGRQQAEQQMAQQLASTQATFQEACKKLNELETIYLNNLGRQLINGLQDILTHTIANAAEHYPQDILDKHLREILTGLPKNNELKLIIHPETAAFHDKLAQTEATIQNHTFKIEHNANLAVGDCTIIWENGGVEATVNNTIQSLQQALQNLHADPQSIGTEAEVTAPDTPETVEETTEENSVEAEA